VQQHVAVGVPSQAFRVVDGDSANLEWDARDELMRVPTESDARRGFLSLALMADS
jgi:hypothetical protein